MDPLCLGGPHHALAACLGQGGVELPQDEGHGEAGGGGGLSLPTIKDYYSFRQQSPHHGRSSMYEDDKRRDMMIKPSPGIKYIAVYMV